MDKVIDLLLGGYGLGGIIAAALILVIVKLDNRLQERDAIITKLRDERSEKQIDVINKNTASNLDLVRVVEGMSQLVQTRMRAPR